MAKKLLTIMFALMLTAGLLAGCGSRDENPPSGGEIGDSVQNNNNVIADDTDNGGNAETDVNTDNGAQSGDGTEDTAPDTENENPDSTVPDGSADTDSAVTPDEENVSDNPENSEIPDETLPLPEIGSRVGDLCPSLDLEGLGGETVNIEDYRGKIVVINIWGTWCPPCRAELPDFDRVAAEYDGEVVVVAVHSYYNRSQCPSYVNTNFPNSKIVFAYDTSADEYHSLVGGTVYYPRTVILDKNGVITYGDDGAVSYEFLVSEIAKAKSK